MQSVRNIVLLVIGAVILVLEIEFHDEARLWVILLSLTMMGLVTFDQAVHWLGMGNSPVGSTEPEGSAPSVDPTPIESPPPTTGDAA